MRRATRSAALVAFALAGLAACDLTGGEEPEAKPPRPTEADWPRVEVAPNELRVVRVGEPLTIEAHVTDILGEPMADYPWEWRYADGEQVDAVAQSPEPGTERLTVTLHRAGEVTFTAVVRMCEQSDVHDCVREFPVVVHAWGGPAVTVRLSAEAVALVPGEARPLVATARRADGDPSDEPVTFESASPGVATVDARGILRGVAPGEARIIARAGGAEAEVAVTVAAGAPYVPAFAEPALMSELADGLAFAPVGDFEEMALLTARGPVVAGVLRDASIASRPMVVLRAWTGSGWSTEQVSEPFEEAEQPRLAIDGAGTLYVLYRDALRGRPVVAWRASGDGGPPGAWQRRTLEVVPRPVAVELQTRQELWVLDRERAHPRERLSVIGRPGGGAWVSYLEVSPQFPCHDAHFLGTVSPEAADSGHDPAQIELVAFRSWGTVCQALNPDSPRIEHTVLVDGAGALPALGARRVPHWRSDDDVPAAFLGEALPGFVDDDPAADPIDALAVVTFGDRRYWFGEDPGSVAVGDRLGGRYRDELRGLGGVDPRPVLADLPRVYFLGSEGDRWWWSSVALPRGAPWAAGRDAEGADRTGPNGPWRLTVTPGTPTALTALPAGGLLVTQSGAGHEWASFLTYRADAPGAAFRPWGAADRHWTPPPAGPPTALGAALFVAGEGALFRSADDGASWWLYGSVPRWPNADVRAEQAVLPDGRAVVVLGWERGADWELQPWVADDARVPTAFWPGPALLVEHVAEPAGEAGVTRGTRALAWPAGAGEEALTTLVVGFSTPPELWTLERDGVGLDVLDRRVIAAPEEAGNKVLWASRGLQVTDGSFWVFAQNAGDITSTRPLLRVDLTTAAATAIPLPGAFYGEPFIGADMALPPVLLELDDGRILIAAAVPVAGGAYERTRAVYATTSDDGGTWTTPRELYPDGGNGQVVWDATAPGASGVVILLGDNAALSSTPQARAWPPGGGSVPLDAPPMVPLVIDLPTP